MPTKRIGTRGQRSVSHIPCDVTRAVHRAPHQAGVRPIEAVGYQKIDRWRQRYRACPVPESEHCMGDDVRDDGVRHELLMARLGRATASPGHECVQA
jgi:hypothetical protein